MKQTIVSGSFDNIQSQQVRFLEEANRVGQVQVLLWSDRMVQAVVGNKPKFPESERLYLLEAIRYVDTVTLIDDPEAIDRLPLEVIAPQTAWVVTEEMHCQSKENFCARYGLEYHMVPDEQLQGFPDRGLGELSAQPGRKKALVTGCFDWLHSGHIRFFEEVTQLGDLYVVVGSDANLRLLKGKGHPLFHQAERLYMVQAIRTVKGAVISTGSGWMDAEPEIEIIQPDLYVVNEDGDNPEKREFCRKHHLDYIVLKRTPKDGLPRRESRLLRGDKIPR